MRRMFSTHWFLLVSLAAACSDPSGSDVPARLVIDGGDALRTLLVGDWRQLAARAVTAAGRDAGPVAVTWSTSNAQVASIDARGELRVATSYTACDWVTPGDCAVRITARAGDLAAEQTITILPYPPALSVSVLQIDLELGDSTPLTARVSLEGREVPWCRVVYSSLDPSIALADAARGIITAVDEGSTFVDVGALGPVCPTVPERVRVINHPRWHTLSIIPDTEAAVAAGTTLQLVAQVRNGKGVEYPAIVVSWFSSDPAIATVENGLVHAIGCTDKPCQVSISARSGKLVATKLIVIE